MAITKNSACGLTATGYFTDETTPVVPGTFEDVTLMYYTVTQYCNADAITKYTLFQKEMIVPLVSFTLTGNTFPGPVIGNFTLSFDRTMTFVSGTRYDGTTTVTLDSTNWTTVNFYTNLGPKTYTYTLVTKDVANNTYSFVFSYTISSTSYADLASLITDLNDTSIFTDNTSYIATPQYSTIDSGGTITFNSYAFDSTTSNVIGDGVFNMMIYNHGYTNTPSLSVGTYTISTESTAQCLLMYCDLLCNAVQASTVENVDKTELWALLEALKQADICTTCNSDLCNIIGYTQAIINETDCKC